MPRNFITDCIDSQYCKYKHSKGQSIHGIEIALKTNNGECKINNNQNIRGIQCNVHKKNIGWRKRLYWKVQSLCVRRLEIVIHVHCPPLKSVLVRDNCINWLSSGCMLRFLCDKWIMQNISMLMNLTIETGGNCVHLLARIWFIAWTAIVQIIHFQHTHTHRSI